MEIRHPEVGICGLSCRLCPHHHTDAESRCGGCKSESRMAVGCPFITCAVKSKGIEFCWECDESGTCERWAGHREFGRTRDTFVCYASLDENIAAIGRNGLDAFVDEQSERERLLVEMLAEFNEGRSKTYYCIAATVLGPSELSFALESARGSCDGMDVREKAKVLHALLDAAASARSIRLALRK
jgi:hypothetical protein